jgi:hypothetical protein
MTGLVSMPDKDRITSLISPVSTFQENANFP